VAATLVLALAAGSARAQDRTVSAAEVGPTQTEIGQYAADFKLASWKKEAAGAGVDLASFVRTTLTSKFAQKPIGAIVDPRGRVRLLDGHHKIIALRQIERTLGISVPVRVTIVHDYTGSSPDHYAEHLTGVLGKGYFGARPPAQAAARVATLPDSFDALADNPLRSVLGVVFTQHGLEGSWFADYIQFHVGERMLSKGLKRSLARRGWLDSRGNLPREAAANPAIVAHVARALFGDRALMRFVRARIKPEFRSQALTAMRRATVASPTRTSALRAMGTAGARRAPRLLDAPRRARPARRAPGPVRR
jgi:hypothetical protein